jgi:hypothetical protein
MELRRQHMENADSGVETLSIRRALRGTSLRTSPAPRSTEPWERSLGGLGQNRALPLKSAQAGLSSVTEGSLTSMRCWLILISTK